MRNVFYYVYYRIARFYLYWNDRSPFSAGMQILLGSLSLYVCSFIIIFCHQKEVEPPIAPMFTFTIISCFLGAIWGNTKLFAKLDIKYKKDSNRILKGWLIFIFILFSLILYLISWFI